MEGGLLRLLIFSSNETHLQHSCPKGKNRSKSDWQLKATKSCLQFKLLSDRMGRLYVLAVGGRCKLLVCIQMWETWRHGTDRTTMHGDKHMLAWLAGAVIHAVQPGKWTKSKFDRCKGTDKQRRGRAHPPLPNSSVLQQHAPLLFKAKQKDRNCGPQSTALQTGTSTNCLTLAWWKSLQEQDYRENLPTDPLPIVSSLQDIPLAFFPPKQPASSFFFFWEPPVLVVWLASSSWYLSAPGTSLWTW